MIAHMAKISRRTLIGGVPVALLAQQDETRVQLPRTVKVGIIGVVGHTAVILDPLPSLPDVEVVAIAEADEKARARFVKNPRVATARQYADYRQMLDKEKLDVVAVCNDNGARSAAIIACAERKVHIAAEKPLATNRNDFHAVRKAVAANDVRLTMLLPMRFWPAFVAMRRIVESGEIGEVAQVASQKSYRTLGWERWKSRYSSYGSTILWIGPHSVDLMRYVSGRELMEAVSFQAHIGAPQLGEMENSTGTLFRMDNGGVATMRLDYLRPDTAPTHEDDRLRVAGTKGVVEFQASTGVTVISSAGKPRVITDVPRVTPLFTEFLQAVYLGKKPTLDLYSIYRVNEIVLAADESARNPRLVSTT